MTSVTSASAQQKPKIVSIPQDTKSKSSGSTSAASGAKPKTSVFTKKQEAKQKAAAENKELGLVNTNGAGTKVKSKSGKEYTVVGNATNGRKIVKDANGQTQVLAQDGTLLKKDYVKSSVQKANQAAAAQKNKEQAELKSLGLTNTEGAGAKVKSKSGNTFTVVGTASNGRKIVKDSKGQTQVLAQDGTLLNKDFVKRDVKWRTVASDSKSAQQAALETMNAQLKTAQKAFQKQLDQDGWAADVADGISNIWGWIGENGNQAWRVRRDLQTYTQNMQQLQKAAKQGDEAFNAKFKQLYGKNFDQKAMAEYVKNPTAANYQKAFGTKNDIKTRVDNYNSSQQSGAEAVKTTAKIGAGVAIGIATGGTGFVALGATALATGAASLVIDETDRLKVTDIATKGEVKFREGTDHKKILTSAAFDGISVYAGGVIGKAAIGVTKGAATFGAKAARLAINTTGDVAVGAAQEYVETGEVTAGGVISNAAMSAIGGTVVDGTLQALGKGLKYAKNKIKGGNIDIDVDTKKLTNAVSDIDLPSSGKVKPDVDIDLPSAHTKPDIDVNTAHAKADVDVNPKVNADVEVSTPHAKADVDVPAKHTTVDTDAQIRTNGAGTETSVAKKKTYVAPETRTTEFVLQDDIMATPKPAAKPVVKSVELKTTDGWQNFKTKNGEITVVNSDGRIFAGEVGGNGAKPIRLQKGETKILGQTSDGLDIVLARSTSGEYSVQHVGEKKSFWSKMFGGKKSVTTESAPVQTKSNKSKPGIEIVNKKSVDVKILNRDNKEVTSVLSADNLKQIRTTNPVQYNVIAQKELAKLQVSNPKLYNEVKMHMNHPNVEISENLLDAIHRINNGQTLVAKLDNNIDLSQISKHVSNGSVCSVNGKLYVNDNGKIISLKLSQEKFEELFPPVETALTQQTNLGDCWLMSTLSSQMDVPKGRVELYKRFRQDGNNIIVSTPGKPDVVFENGMVLSAKGISEKYSKGLRMIEQTAAVHRLGWHSPQLYTDNTAKVNISDMAKSVSNPNALMQRLRGGNQDEALDLLGKFNYTTLGNDVNEALLPTTLTEMKKCLIDNANNPNVGVVFTVGTDKNGALAKNIGLMNWHAMKIVGMKGNKVHYVDQQRGNCLIKTVDIDELMNVMSGITVTDFKPPVQTPKFVQPEVEVKPQKRIL